MASVWAKESPTTSTRTVATGAGRPRRTVHRTPPSDEVSTVPPLPTATQSSVLGQSTPSRVWPVGEASATQEAPASPVRRTVPEVPTATQRRAVGQLVASRLADVTGGVGDHSAPESDDTAIRPRAPTPTHSRRWQPIPLMASNPSRT